MDLPVIFSRSARRAGLKQEYTTGFSPHPRISLAPPLATGIAGLAEPADFWFEEWNGDSLFRWNERLPEGLKILKCAEITEDTVLAKSIDAAVYSFEGADAPLDAAAESILCAEAERLNALHACSCEGGRITLSVGELERCGAGALVKALIASGVVSGWAELQIERLAVGRWDVITGTVLPLI